jgi:hypothetical protein
MVIVTIIQLSLALFSRQLPVGGYVGFGSVWLLPMLVWGSSPAVVVGLVFESG